MSIEEKVIEIISNQTKQYLSNYSLDYDLSKDETIDSIDHMEIIMAIESYYKIDIDDVEITNNSRIFNLIKLIESKLS